MKLFLKKIILWFIKTTNLHILITEAIKEDKRNKALKYVTGSGFTLHSESTIENFQNNPNNIIIGNNSHVRGHLQLFKYGGYISIGDYCYVGENSKIWSGASIVIGNNVLISHNVNIIDSNSHELDYLERAQGYKHIIEKGHPSQQGSIVTAPIIIEDYVWISFNVIITKGVRIGKGAVIGAGSIITKDVPEFALVTGPSATTIKFLT